MNHLLILFCKSVYIDNLMKLVAKELVIMTKKLYPGFSRVAYGLCTEILDSLWCVLSLSIVLMKISKNGPKWTHFAKIACKIVKATYF